jgi:hypothetical protein
MKKLWRFTGWALAFLGVLHTVVFVSFGLEAFMEMFAVGLLNSLGMDTGRLLAWYGGLWFGAMMVLFGLFAQSWIKATAKPLPCYIGWSLAAIGLLGTTLQPGSGAPLVCLLGLIIVFVRPADASTEI